MSYCQHCGAKLNKLTDFSSGAALSIPAAGADLGQAGAGFSSAYRKTPYRKMEMGADVLVPLTQSVITGAVVATGLGVITPFLPWSWYVGPITGAITIGVAWGYRLAVSRETLWIVEEFIGQDIDGDGHTGRPERHTIEVWVKDGKSRKTFDIPGDLAALPFIQAVVEGDTFTEATAQATGYGVTAFRQLRDLFVKNRWAVWRNPSHPQQGVELTLIGRQILRQILTDNDPLPPATG